MKYQPAGELTLEQRIGRLEAINAIKALKHEYFRAADAKDPARMAVLLTEDFEAVFPGIAHWKGHKEYMEAFTERSSTKTPDGQWVWNEMHFGQHGDVTIVDDDTATGRWSLHYVQADLSNGPTGKTFTALSLEYEDVYVRREGRWLISRCIGRPKATIVQPLAEGAVVNHQIEASSV